MSEIKRTQTIIKNDFQHKLILSTVLLTLISLNLIIIIASYLEQEMARSTGMSNIFNYSVAVMEVIALVVVPARGPLPSMANNTVPVNAVLANPTSKATIIAAPARS